MQGDPAYELGRFLGPMIVVALIGYVIVRLSKKRNPNTNEWIIIGIVALVATLATAAGRNS